MLKLNEMVSKVETLKYNTKERLHFITITKDIQDLIEKSGVKTGSILIQSHHTTCSLWINEDEKNLIGLESDLGYTPDIKKVLDRFAHPDENYGHNDIKDHNNPNGKRDTHLCEPDSCGIINECKNGHAHAQAMLFNNSLNMIINEGKLVKGRWQEILLIELDHNRERSISVLIQGN